MRHVVVIKSSAGVSVVRARMSQVSRAISVREARGEVVGQVGCSVSCPCGGEGF